MFRRRPIAAAAPRRSGVALVEMAFILPVFTIFCVGLMEFGHAFLVVNTLNAAAKRGARYGATEGISTSQVESRIESILGAAIDPSMVTIYVKNAGAFDQDEFDAEEIEYSTLPDMDLSTAEATQLYIVRIEVDYDDVAILPPFWAQGIRLSGQSVMRHE